MPAGVYGCPSVYIEHQPSYTANINQIAELNGVIYVLDAYDGIVTAYDSSGNYKYTISFLSYLNGRFSLAVSDDKLYVRDNHWDIYVFQDETFTEFVAKDNASYILQTVDFEDQNKAYEVRLDGSVWKVDGDKPVCVISRPYYALLSNGRIVCAIGVIAAIIAAILRRLDSQKGGRFRVDSNEKLH